MRERVHEEENQEIFEGQRLGVCRRCKYGCIDMVFLHVVWVRMGNSAVPHGHESNRRLEIACIF